MTTPDTPDSVPIATIAEHLGISARRVQQLVRAGVLPTPAARGQYDLDGCAAAYGDYLAALAATREDPSRLALMNARLRLLLLAVAKKESELASLAEVKATAHEMYALAVQVFDESRLRLAPLVAAATDPLAVDRILAAEIRHICVTFSAAGARRAAGEAAGSTI